MPISAPPATVRSAVDWFRCVRPNAAAPVRLFCFPPVGAGTSFYARWGTAWDDIEVWCLQAPGRERRFAERPLTQMRDLVDALGPAIPLDRKFAFFGHSLGAMVACELAYRLGELDLPLPSHLFLSACPGPGARRPGRDRHKLTEPELLRYLRSLGGMPDEVLASPDMMSFVLPTIRADFAIADTHVHRSRPPLPVAVGAFGGEADEDVPPASIAAWREIAGTTFDMRTYPGGHFYFNDAEAPLWEEVRRQMLHVATDERNGGPDSRRAAIIAGRRPLNDVSV